MANNILSNQTVKAIVALTFTFGTVGLVAFSVVRADGDIPAALAALVGMTGIIVNNFFHPAPPAA